MAARRNVLFICTGNACRSQMAEAILRHLGGDRFEARSAGTDPAGFVHPLALETMRRMDIATTGQHSKGCEEVAGQRHDVIITLCDHAAAELSTAWPGDPATAHWGLPDPSFAPGSDEDRLAAAADVAETLQRRIQRLVSLPLDELDEEQYQQAVRDLAKE